MNIAPYLYALFMASIDAVIMPLLKAKKLGMLTGNWMFPVAAISYAAQPFIFYKSLSTNSMTVMNILRDVMSDVLVTIVGIFFFGETLIPIQWLGLALALIGITLLGCCDDGKGGVKDPKDTK
jgi:drug/metabolite transporter (DMT)-like permease